MKKTNKKIIHFIANTIRIIFFVPLLPFFLIVILPYTRLKNQLISKKRIKPNILWGPAPIINIHYNSESVKKMGYISHTLVYKPYRITHSSMFDYNLSKWFKIPLMSLFIPFIVMIWASFTHDIFHFYFNGGFLYKTNLFLLKAEFLLWKIIGKKVIVAAYGSDVRQESITRKSGKYHAYMDMTSEEIFNETQLTEQQIKSRITWIGRFSSTTISMGDMIEYTPSSVNNIFYWAINTQDWYPVYETNNIKVKIIHAPNHKQYKGTRFLKNTIERLKKERYPIDLVLIENMENAQARKHYEQADIVAEQFIIGWHGFFAVEAMALGKPVLCYIRKQEYLPSWIKSPIVNTNPDTLYENLKKLIENKKLRIKIGEKGRKYVENVFSLKRVGRRFQNIYEAIY